MGFGHRVYKNYDPRARGSSAKHLDGVFEVRGKSPLLDVATELEKRALDDEYFTSRKLYPNVDFYSGLIYEALGLPGGDVSSHVRDSGAPADGSRSGWRWSRTPSRRSRAPRQIYTGERDRDYVPMDQRA